MKFLNWFKHSPEKFQKGDKVTAFGNIGTVKNISSNGMFVEVAFPETTTTIMFNIDGRVFEWNKVPTLRKV